MLSNDMTIRTLIDKFFDGTTSIEEEHALYNYFKSDNISPEFAQYSELFKSLSSIDTSHTTVRLRKKSFIIRYRHAVIGMTAAAVIAFGFFMIRNISHERQLAKIYEGSYVIIKGKRIDDLSKIKNDIEKTVQLASTIENKADINAIIEDAERNVLDNIHDKKERERIYRLLNE